MSDPTLYLKEMVDLDNGSPEEIHKQVEVALREALDSNFEALSNVNIGQVYVPMENSGVHGGGGGRSESKLETPDYDTFGSIDSLIFEPKLGAESQQQVSFERIERIALSELNLNGQLFIRRGSWTATPALIKVKESQYNNKQFYMQKKVKPGFTNYQPREVGQKNLDKYRIFKTSKKSQKIIRFTRNINHFF